MPVFPTFVPLFSTSLSSFLFFFLSFFLSHLRSLTHSPASSPSPSKLYLPYPTSFSSPLRTYFFSSSPLSFPSPSFFCYSLFLSFPQFHVSLPFVLSSPSLSPSPHSSQVFLCLRFLTDHAKEVTKPTLLIRPESFRMQNNGLIRYSMS